MDLSIKEQSNTYLSDIPYDSALIQLIKNNGHIQSEIIIAYELGRRKGIIGLKEKYITTACKKNFHSECYNRHGRCSCKCHIIAIKKHPDMSRHNYDRLIQKGHKII